ncbi:MAG: hypothetical protein D6729_02315, partial [Deltaproteobacteria bacterium]
SGVEVVGAVGRVGCPRPPGPAAVAGRYGKIHSVEWKSEPPLTLGSQQAFVVRFVGRRLAYTTRSSSSSRGANSSGGLSMAAS